MLSALPLLAPGELSAGVDGHACRDCEWERPADDPKDRCSTAEAAQLHKLDSTECDGTQVYSVANCRRGKLDRLTVRKYACIHILPFLSSNVVA